MARIAEGLRIVRPADRRPDVASGAMRREAAISRELVGAERIWVGYVELPPAMSSGEVSLAITLDPNGEPTRLERQVCSGGFATMSLLRRAPASFLMPSPLNGERAR